MALTATCKVSVSGDRVFKSKDSAFLFLRSIGQNSYNIAIPDAVVWLALIALINSIDK